MKTLGKMKFFEKIKCFKNLNRLNIGLHVVGKVFVKPQFYLFE